MSVSYQVDSEDAAFLFAEKLDNPSHFSLVGLYDQSDLGAEVVRFRHIMQLVTRRLDLTPVLRRRIKRIPGDLDYPYWVDESEFDIDYHVRHLGLPQPGDWRQFCIQISRLHSRSLDVRRPLWELYVIEGLNNIEWMPEGSFALYLKVHHCAMDEFTAVEFFQSLHQSTPDVQQHKQEPLDIRSIAARDPGIVDVVRNAVVGNSARLLGFTLSQLQHSPAIARNMTYRGLSRVRSFVGGDKDAPAQAAHFAAAPVAHRVFDGVKLTATQLDRIRQKVPRATAAHALTLICSEATRLYLEECGGGSAAPITAKLQVNTRNAGAHALAGNHMATIDIECYPHVENLEGRLMAIVGTAETEDEQQAQERSFDLRARYEDLPAFANSILSKVPRDLFGGGQQEDCVGIAILQGPGQPLYLQGAHLTDITTINPLLMGCGLVFSAVQYESELFLSFTSDREMLQEPGRLRAHLLAVLEKLDSL